MIFAWYDADEARKQAVGLTLDISVGGAFVFTPNPPPLDAKVKFECLFPPIRGAAQSPRLYGQAQVVRVDSHESEADRGFALAGKPFILRRREDCGRR
jgi:hypothetical protein